MTRLIAAPVIGYLVLHDHHVWAAGLFAYAGITDVVDGWIARRWNTKTVVGTVIDPMADKALMTILTVCLTIKGALPGMFCSATGLELACCTRMNNIAGGPDVKQLTDTSET
jgi:phosphatidylglycerophosphate synthase